MPATKPAQQERELLVSNLMTIQDISTDQPIHYVDKDGWEAHLRRHTNPDGGLGGYVERTSMVPSSVQVDRTSIVLNNCIVRQNASIRGRTIIGRDVQIESYCLISDSLVGKGSFFGYNSKAVMAHFGIGCRVGKKATIKGARDHTTYISRGCEIHDGAKVGRDCIMGPGSKLGAWERLHDGEAMNEGETRGELSSTPHPAEIHAIPRRDVD